MFTLFMQTCLSEKWYNLGMFKTPEDATAHANWVRSVFVGVKFQLTVGA